MPVNKSNPLYPVWLMQSARRGWRSPRGAPGAGALGSLLHGFVPLEEVRTCSAVLVPWPYLISLFLLMS